ncbi:hypothetical protein D3C79_940700 [compost metagenome]
MIGHGLILGHTQLRLLPAHQGQGPAVQAFALAQQFAGIFQQGRASLGQAWLAAAAALEQGHTEVGLQQGNAVAHRRLRLALLARHRRERAQLGDPHEHAQLLQIPLLGHATYLQKR